MEDSDLYHYDDILIASKKVATKIVHVVEYITMLM